MQGVVLYRSSGRLRPSRHSRSCVRPCLRSAIVLSCVALSLAHSVAGPITANYSAATDVPIVANGFEATGKTLNISLGFVPAPGTDLTVIRNQGPAIHGVFANIAQGQTITLGSGGLIYKYVADYHGGTGNDLVLLWTTDQGISPAALTKLDSQLILAVKQIRGIAPFHKATSFRPNIPIKDEDKVLVNVEGSISNDLVNAITQVGGQVVSGFVTANSARAMVPVSQLESLAARDDVSSMSVTKLSVISKIGL